MQKRFRRSLSTFVIFSMLLHLSVFLTLKLLKPTRQGSTENQVQVEFVSADELMPPETPVKKKKLKDQRKQIVEQQKQVNDEIDEKTRLLSAFNQTVQRQTVADRAGEFKNTAQGGQPDEGRPDGEKDQLNPLQDDKPIKRAKGELPDLRALSPKFSLTQGLKAPKFDDNGDPSQTEDYLKDMNKGMQTLLSTREFVYYSYYARIKDALRQHWEPTVREKVKIIYRQGRSIASANDRVTQVLVTLNPKGELIKAEVLGPSGVEALDAAAIEAFQDAAPFPNPPKGMVESDGTIKIRWDFVLEV